MDEAASNLIIAIATKGVPHIYRFWKDRRRDQAEKRVQDVLDFLHKQVNQLEEKLRASNKTHFVGFSNI